MSRIHHRGTEGAENGLAELNPISEAVIGAAIDVHRALGPGLLESAYSECLARELAIRRIPFEREVALPIEYKGIRLDAGYRMDFVVSGRIVLEVKAIEAIDGIHEAQLLTYLRLSGLRIGLLLNFNVELLRDGIVRRIL